MTFDRNNLDRSASPYLRQHADNPVWWQQWSREALAFAAEHGRPLLVSVGYSTCHWCHVMAREAFSDPECASILNREFVPIKVDREERPDIDHYLMSYLVTTTGSGGWPLNAFLTADGRPFFAMTYASVDARFDMPPFADLLRRVAAFHREKRETITEFVLEPQHSVVHAHDPAHGAGIADPSDVESRVNAMVNELDTTFDPVHSGFGTTQKFPPHSTLLFLQHVHALGLSARAGAMARDTLDAMMLGGLHDHLQGGFFRYCVDREWSVPHFEKMLYDQGMLLWNYAVAGRLFDSEAYRTTARGIVTALEETFRVGALYASGHDADAAHREGSTYLWKLDEIEAVLSAEELDAFRRVFPVTSDGSLEGRNHLVRSIAPGVDAAAAKRRKGPAPPDAGLVNAAMKKLLAARRRRPQPDRDEKVIVSWNALAGCAFVEAYRSLGNSAYLDRANEIADALLDRFVRDDHVAHSAVGERVQEQEFLSDVAALLLLMTMLHEEAPAVDSVRSSAVETLRARLASLANDGTWWESRSDDFTPVPADPFDQPTPSGISLAEYALLRDDIASHRDYGSLPFSDPHVGSLRNVAALASSGYLRVIESPEPVEWSKLPFPSMQMRGDVTTTCFRGVCYPGLVGSRTGAE